MSHPRVSTPAGVTELVCELLDAHADTVQLAEQLAREEDVRWCVHLDYLRALQRMGHETLAHLSSEEAP